MSGVVTPVLLLPLALQMAVGTIQPPPRDSWWSVDKSKHFLLGAFVQGMSYGTLRALGGSHDLSLGGASAASITIGIGKELRDRRAYGRFSTRDLVWTVAGAGAMTVLLRRSAR